MNDESAHPAEKDTEVNKPESTDLISKFVEKHKHKLQKADFLLISILSIALAALSFFVAAGAFYNLQEGNVYVKYVGYVLSLPAIVTTLVFSFIFRSSRDSEGAALGTAILAVYVSPVVAFVLWFFAFYFIARLIRHLLESEKLFVKHSVSIVIFLLIVTPFVYYRIGNNEVNACLSGSLNFDMQSGYFGSEAPDQPSYFTVGPDFCFKDIIERKNLDTPGEKVDFCEGLSSRKVVGNHGEGAGLYDFPVSLTYRDYCLYSLKPLEQSALCKLVGETGPAGEQTCNIYFNNKSEAADLSLYYPQESLQMVDIISGVSPRDRLIYELVAPEDINASTTQQINFAKSPISREIFPNQSPIKVSLIEKVYVSQPDTFDVSGVIPDTLGTIEFNEAKELIFTPNASVALTATPNQEGFGTYGTKAPTVQIDRATFDYEIIGSGQWQLVVYASDDTIIYTVADWLNSDSAKKTVIIPIPNHFPIVRFGLYKYNDGDVSVKISNINFSKADELVITNADPIGYRVKYTVGGQSTSQNSEYFYYVDETGFKYSF